MIVRSTHAVWCQQKKDASFIRLVIKFEYLHQWEYESYIYIYIFTYGWGVGNQTDCDRRKPCTFPPPIHAAVPVADTRPAWVNRYKATSECAAATTLLKGNIVCLQQQQLSPYARSQHRRCSWHIIRIHVRLSTLSAYIVMKILGTFVILQRSYWT